MKKLIAITLTAALALAGSFTASLTKTADAAAYTTKTIAQNYVASDQTHIQTPL